MSDIYGDQTVLLLHCDGSDGSTDIKDSAYRSTATVFGNARLSTTYKHSGVSSLYLDGVGDYVDFPLAAAGTAFNVTGDFTVEFTIKPEGIGSQRPIISTYASNWSQVWCYFDIRADGVLEAAFGVDRAILLVSDVALVSGTVYHIAVSRVGALAKLFINGVAQAATSTSTVALLPANMVAGGGFRIGRDSRTVTYYQGYIDEVRVTNGVGRYTANFTPPAGAFDDPTIFKADDSPVYWDKTKLLMHMDGANNSTYFRDERHAVLSVEGAFALSTTKYKFGTSALYADGSSGNYRVTASLDAAPSAADFTFEGWYYILQLTTEIQIAHLFSDDVMTYSAGCRLAVLSDGTLIWNNSSAANIRTAGKVSVNNWYHIAAVRTGGNVTVYLNGVLVLTVANSANYTLSKVSVGGSWYSIYKYYGYIDAVRLTVGVARYTARFIPPTRAFTTPTGTDQYWPNVVLSMPMSGTPGLAADVSDLKGHGVNIFGDTKLSAAKSKFHGASCYFDGTGDYILIPASTDFAFGTGDFTVEMWVYFTGVSMTFMDFGGSVIYLEVQSNSIIRFGSNFGHIVGAAASAINTWHHVAVSRIGTVFRLFIDGVVAGSITSSGSFGTSAVGMNLGASTLGGFRLSGYLSNIRITKGVGRYSGNFTPPVEPFPSAVPQALSGIVRDHNGNPTNRTVRSYRRSDGKLIGTAISDPTTGLFTLPADNVDEHFVVVFDDTKNALVYDHVLPVI